MALVSTRAGLNQGTSNSVADAAFTVSAGANTTITGVATLPAIAATEFFEIREHSLANNNGLYIATGAPTTSSLPCTKVFGANPSNSALEPVIVLGTTGVGSEKSVFFDTQSTPPGVAILEKGNVDAAGVTGQAQYSFTLQEWKDDAFLIANAPFPMLAIDSDAGKYVIGQDISGNNNGFVWLDNVTHSIRTRKLLRNAGWDEVDVNGVTQARYFNATTLGTFEDAVNDNAYYQFGNNTIVDDTVNFTFNGPVNEAVQFFEEQAQTSLAILGTSITRIGGSFITEGYKVGGQVTIRNAEDAGNNGVHLLSAVTATVLTTTGLTVNAADTAAFLAVNNDNAVTLRLRVRDADLKGKTFGQANLASAGKTILGNFVFSFPLANSADQKIDVTDAGIDVNSDGTADVAPYSGMSITYFAAPQARTDLVGGSANFGIIVNGNNGTSQQVFEFLQWSLRSTGGNGTGDIDAGAEVAIGRAMDGLARFVGDTGEFGTADGINFPVNPDGGGSGVYVDSLAAASKNSVTFFDNTNAAKVFPETIAVTLDFNQIAIDDTTTEYDLFYDRTTRDVVADFVMTTVASGTITSAGANLPNTAGTGVGSYIRISGLVGGNIAMNGVYQIVTETTPGSSWVVTRYDGATIVAVTVISANLDQNAVDTPDAIHVHTNVREAEVTAADRPGTAALAFVAPDQVTDTGLGLAKFTVGMFIEIEGTTANDGIYEVATSAAGQLDFVEQTITAELVGVNTTGVITEIVSGLASVDLNFSYDFSNNIQGDKAGGITTFVKAKAVGSTGAQYVQSTVQSIVTATPLTIPVAPATERNYS